MSREFGKRECDRCGEMITAFCPTLPTLSSIGKILNSGQNAVAAEIVRLEDVSIDLASEYLRHRVFLECPVAHAICPFCGGQLASRKAKQCLHCHRSWHGVSEEIKA